MAESEDMLGSGLWSDLKTLEQVAAMNCLPSLVRLESGYYGQVEELSFSQGDFLALQTCVVLNGQHIFLAHYMSEESNSEMNRALLIVPIGNPNVAHLDVFVMTDPTGEIYQKYVSDNFPDVNWNNFLDEQLALLCADDTEDFADVRVYQNLSVVPLRKRERRARSYRESWTIVRTSGQFLPTIEDCPVLETDQNDDNVDVIDKPPPRPPRPVTTALSSEWSCVTRDEPPRIPPRKTSLRISEASTNCQSTASSKHPVHCQLVRKVSSSEFQEWSSFTFAEIAIPGNPYIVTITPDTPETTKTCETSDTKVPASKNKQKIFSKINLLPSGRASKKKSAGTPKKYVRSASPPISACAAKEVTPSPADDENSGQLYEDARSEMIHLDSDQLQQSAVDSRAKPGHHERKTQPSLKKTVSTYGGRKPTVRVPPHSDVQVKCDTPASTPAVSSTGSLENQSDPSCPAIEEMSVKTLCQCLQLCGLTKMAQTCSTHVLDGKFLSTCSDDTLVKEPFVLSVFELTKWHRIKLGWRPKVD